MPQEQPAYVPSQFYTTKYTLLLFIVFHLISGLVYAFLAINFLSQPELSRAYTEKEADAARPQVLVACSIGAITVCTGVLALFSWQFAFTGIFAFLCAMSTAGYYFCALSEPVVEPLSSLHYIPLVLGAIMLVLTSFYAYLQLEMGIFSKWNRKKRRRDKKKGKQAGSLTVDTERALVNYIAESRSTYYVKQTLVVGTVLHAAWTIGYFALRVLYFQRIGSPSEPLETVAEIDLEMTMRNEVLKTACYAQSILATGIIFTGNCLGLVGVFWQKSIQLVAFAGTLVFAAFYRFIAVEDFELTYWLNLFFSLALLTVVTTFTGLLVVYTLATAITQESSLAATISATSTQAALVAAALAAAETRNKSAGLVKKTKEKKKTKKKEGVVVKTEEERTKEDLRMEVVKTLKVNSNINSATPSSSSSSASEEKTPATKVANAAFEAATSTN